jgi:hypothetical protein
MIHDLKASVDQVIFFFQIRLFIHCALITQMIENFFLNVNFYYMISPLYQNFHPKQNLDESC